MKALSFKQPWLWATLTRGKLLDNRPPNSPAAITKYRGEIALHASVKESAAYYRQALDFMVKRGLLRPDDLPVPEDLDRGGIVGQANLVAVYGPSVPDALIAQRHPRIDLRWRMSGFAALILDEVEPLPFLECRGALGLWDAPEVLDVDV
jgi:hypothetical protein